MKDSFNFKTDEQLNKDLTAISKVLSDDENIQMPESLRSSSLMHLLADEPDLPVETEQVKEKSAIDITKKLPKKFIPLFTAVVAAVLLIAILPKLNSNQLDTAPVNISSEMAVADSVKESAPLEENDIAVAADATTENYKEELPGETDIPGEDLSEYFPEGDELPEVNADEVKETQEADSNTEMTYEESKERTDAIIMQESTTDKPSDTKDTPVKGGAPAPNAAAEAALPQGKSPVLGGARAAAFAANVSTYYIPSNVSGYSFYWRTADRKNSDEANALVVLEVFQNGNQEPSIKTNISEMYQVISAVTSDDKVFILGQSKTGTVVSEYKGFNKNSLELVTTSNIRGDYLASHVEDKYIYIVGKENNGKDSYPGNNIKLKDTIEQGAVIIAVFDASTNTLGYTSLVGAKGTNALITDGTLAFEYSIGTNTPSKVEIPFNSGNVIEVKIVD